MKVKFRVDKIKEIDIDGRRLIVAGPVFERKFSKNGEFRVDSGDRLIRKRKNGDIKIYKVNSKGKDYTNISETNRRVDGKWLVPLTSIERCAVAAIEEATQLPIYETMVYEWPGKSYFEKTCKGDLI